MNLCLSFHFQFDVAIKHGLGWQIQSCYLFTTFSLADLCWISSLLCCGGFDVGHFVADRSCFEVSTGFG